jgi:hypothetical protein
MRPRILGSGRSFAIIGATGKIDRAAHRTSAIGLPAAYAEDIEGAPQEAFRLSSAKRVTIKV